MAAHYDDYHEELADEARRMAKRRQEQEQKESN